MGGVPSSSLSVERLQGAEVASAHLRISGGSRPAELFSDGYLVNTLWSTEFPRVLSWVLVPFCITILSCRILAFVLISTILNHSRYTRFSRLVSPIIDDFHLIASNSFRSIICPLPFEAHHCLAAKSFIDISILNVPP